MFTGSVKDLGLAGEAPGIFFGIQAHVCWFSSKNVWKAWAGNDFKNDSNNPIIKTFSFRKREFIECEW